MSTCSECRVVICEQEDEGATVIDFPDGAYYFRTEPCPTHNPERVAELEEALEQVAASHDDQEREPVQHCTSLVRAARQALSQPTEGGSNDE